MLNKIEHLLNLNKQRFVILGGLQGAGKSTIAQEFEKAGYEIVCPDTERLYFARKEHGFDKTENELQFEMYKHDKEAWQSAQNKVVNGLKDRKSIVFDAVLSTKKARRQVLSWVEKFNGHKVGLFLDVPLQLAKDQNEHRRQSSVVEVNGEQFFGRYVPEHVIENKFRTIAFPSKEEGLNEIIILSRGIERIVNIDFSLILQDLIKDVRKTVDLLKKADMLKVIFPYLDACWGVSQDNKHHNKLLHEHMIRAAEIIVEKYKDEVDEDTLRLLVLTTLNHDVGKKDTKEFYGKVLEATGDIEANEKVVVLKKDDLGVVAQRQYHKGFCQTFVPYYAIELDENAHFYDHEHVGAIHAYRNVLQLGLDESLAIEIYMLILYHMDLPYQLESNKSMSKFIRKVGKQRVMNLMKIRYADKMSGNTSDHFESTHAQMLEQLSQLMKGEK